MNFLGLMGLRTWITACVSDNKQSYLILSYNRLDFWGDQLSDLDRRIFLFRLFVKCKTTLLRLYILLFANCQHYNADDFSDKPDFNIVYQFNTANQDIFLGRSLSA